MAGKRILWLTIYLTTLGCRGEPRAEEARAPLPDGYELKVVRLRAHPAFAEYTRRAELLRGDSLLAADSLFMDTGGYGRFELVATSTGTLILRGPIESYLIDLKGRTIQPIDSVVAGQKGQVLGIFDDDTRQNWTYRALAPGS
jgi:hypothetical protein